MVDLNVSEHGHTQVSATDEPGMGGAYHAYVITGTSNETLAEIAFQNGPVKETGVNGITVEDLLMICQHRLQCFQSGDFACRENALALTKIEEALHWLDHRTRDRQRRGAEGRDKK